MFSCVMYLYAQNVFRQLTVADGLPCNQVRQIIELPDRQMMVATEGAFCLFNGRNFTTLDCNLDSTQFLPAFGGHDYLWQGDSLLWLKDYYSLYLFDARTRRFRYDYNITSCTTRLKHFIHEPSDTLAQRKHDYLYRFVPRLDSIRQNSNLQYDPIMAYCQDSQGGEWFGLQNSGIIYQPPANTGVRLFRMDADLPRRMVAIDSHTMLVAGELGLHLFDTKRQKEVRTLLQGKLLTAEMHNDSRGRTWISTNQGLYCYDQGQLQLYNKANVPGLLHDFIRFALPIDDRRLLVCNHMHYLGYLYPEEHRWEPLNDKLPALDGYRTMIVAAQLTNRNHVAVCTQNGFFVLDTSCDTLLQHPLIQHAAHFCRKYNCILLDRTGRLWVGTQNGLLLVTNNTLRRITRGDGLSNDCIQSLAEDLSGRIWVATSSGVNRIRLSQSDNVLHIRAFGIDNGLPGVEMTERGICIMADNTLYLASRAGLVALDVQQVERQERALPLVLVGLNVAGREMPLDTLPLHLNYRQNYIDLQVSTLNYAQPHLTRYRYRLLGWDDKGDWHAMPDNDGRLATVRLSALPPGRYIFEIQASTGDDVWGTSLRKSFDIAAPLWLTWWAKVLYVMITLGGLIVLIGAYLQNRRRKLERDNEERVNRLFELREEARHRFAQTVEVHPERITVGGEEERFAERITKVVGEHIDDLEYTVDQLARDMGMSRANLYKKMQTRLGVTPNDFMRNVRLKRATQLLADTDLPVNQVSLMVGFQTPRYFSQTFRQMFGVTPSEYRSGTPPLHSAED